MKILKRLFFFCCLAALCLSTSCFILRGKKAERIVEKFHERYNAGNFSEIYQDSDESFKSGISEDLFIKHMQELQNRMGKFVKINYCTSSERAHTQGRDVYIYCKNEFTNGMINESFTILFDENGVSFSGYHN